MKAKRKTGGKTMQDKNKKDTKKIVIGALLLIAVLAVLIGVYVKFAAKPSQGAKALTIEVIDNEGASTTYEVHTDAEYLRQAMEETEGLTFSGTESEYGMMVETVNGVTADYNVDKSYWAFYVNGEYCNYGIDAQPVADGEAYTIAYTVD